MARCLQVLLATVAIAGVTGCNAPAGDGAGDPLAPAASREPAPGGQVRRASGGGVAGAADIPAPPAAAGHRQRPAPPARAVARPDGGPQASAVAASEQGLAPGEAAFFTADGGIDGGSLREQMHGERWDETVARFEADAIADPDARQLQELYEQALREAVARHGLVLARFGCGLSLCAGTARGPLRDDGYPFDSGNVFQFDGLRTPMILSGLFETGQHVEVRFSFSTDPNVQSMTLWR